MRTLLDCRLALSRPDREGRDRPLVPGPERSIRLISSVRNLHIPICWGYGHSSDLIWVEEVGALNQNKWSTWLIHMFYRYAYLDSRLALSRPGREGRDRPFVPGPERSTRLIRSVRHLHIRICWGGKYPPTRDGWKRSAHLTRICGALGLPT